MTWYEVAAVLVALVVVPGALVWRNQTNRH